MAEIAYTCVNMIRFSSLIKAPTFWVFVPSTMLMDDQIGSCSLLLFSRNKALSAQNPSPHKKTHYIVLFFDCEAAEKSLIDTRMRELCIYAQKGQCHSSDLLSYE